MLYTFEKSIAKNMLYTFEKSIAKNMLYTFEKSISKNYIKFTCNKIYNGLFIGGCFII